MKTKICSRESCIHNNTEQPISNFGKSKQCKDGYHPWCKDCRTAYNKRKKQQIKEYNKRYKPENVEKIKEYEQQNNVQEYRRQFSKQYKQKPAKYDVFYEQINYCEQTRYDPDDKALIQCKCSVCNQWFNPTAGQLHNRIFALKGQKSGEAKLYCSEKCKRNCTVYRQKIYTKNQSIDQQRDSVVQHDLRQLVLERDKHECQRCGSDKKLICHHITGIRYNPLESADVDNCITLCSACHGFVHSQPGCNSNDLKCNNRVSGSN